MTTDDLTLTQIVKQSHENSAAHGFWDFKVTAETIPSKLALIMAEAAEALESYRDPEADRAVKVDVSVFATMINLLDKAYPAAPPSEENLIDTSDTTLVGARMLVDLGRALIKKFEEKPKGFATELADIIIRVGDLAGHEGIDLAAEVARKHEFNLGRPHRHGRVV